jgi:hypothetical protein
LKLELARLFKAHQLTLIRLSDSKNELVRDSLDHLSGESLRRHFESRPSFHLRLEGHYLNLIDFIDGLNQLSYRTYVTNMSVERQGDAGGELKIQIELRI